MSRKLKLFMASVFTFVLGFSLFACVNKDKSGNSPEDTKKYITESAQRVAAITAGTDEEYQLSTTGDGSDVPKNKKFISYETFQNKFLEMNKKIEELDYDGNSSQDTIKKVTKIYQDFFKFLETTAKPGTKS